MVFGEENAGSVLFYAAEMFYNHLEARLLDGSFQSCVSASKGVLLLLLLLQSHLICVKLVSLGHFSSTTRGFKIAFDVLLMRKCSAAILTTKYNDLSSSKLMIVSWYVDENVRQKQL